MKRPITIALAFAVAIALPVATAIAGIGNGKGQVKSLTAKQCNEERRANSGALQATFGDQSGKHAMRNCKRETSSEVNGEVRNAAQECLAMREANPELFRGTWERTPLTRTPRARTRTRSASA